MTLILSEVSTSQPFSGFKLSAVSGLWWSIVPTWNSHHTVPEEENDRSHWLVVPPLVLLRCAWSESNCHRRMRQQCTVNSFLFFHERRVSWYIKQGVEVDTYLNSGCSCFFHLFGDCHHDSWRQLSPVHSWVLVLQAGTCRIILPLGDNIFFWYF